MSIFIDTAYILSALLFGLGLKLLSSPATARRGNLLSALGMFIAVVVTLLNQQIIDFKFIAVGILVGAIIGVLAARLVAMTAMPEMVALLNGFGGIASLLVGWAEYNANTEPTNFLAVTIFLTVLIGGVTFTGSIMAWAKLKEIWIGNFGISKALVFPGQQVFNSLLLAAIVASGVLFVADIGPGYTVFYVAIGLAFVLGIMAVIPIGGADMPVVISLLNSYSGMAACAAGFVIQNNILIVAGSLVGASGIILTNIMCKAMNRSLGNVLFSGFGSVVTAGKSGEQGEAQPISVEDTYYLLEAASSVAFVPGYGLAVAQAQHAVKELAVLLENNGCEVRFAIHPVAGRMPGHMNVLLAEADVPYDQLVEPEDVNPIMETVDVCVVVGANDVVNPSARDDETSSIYGMPIIEVDRAKTVIVMKRSMAAGFAGIQNPLFFLDNTRMLFGDAKASMQGLVSEFKRD
ncbi:MAG: NAD(P)(+) transhydrogenase (Re/Si-specific) subunit beta [Acidobacteriota bacterium]|nr:MAG: NAD(P)(+) transhydrogenase (Re/Si-specific) subunit beta [Acidobacteriota bacterium]